MEGVGNQRPSGGTVRSDGDTLDQSMHACMLGESPELNGSGIYVY